MDLHVLDLSPVLQEKSGMFILLAANVHKWLTGMAFNAEDCHNANKDKSWIQIIFVFVSRTMLWVVMDAFTLPAWEAKFGRDQNVSALLDKISMVLCVFNALMVKNGILKI